jgi:Predicted NADH:ubiquinone oxidoreductase, subunit RnfC
MMGVAQYDLQAPVTKQTNAITCLKKELPAEQPCIRCGRCSRSCPMRLLPLEIERALKIQDQETLTKLQVQSCMECGTCAFVCPSGRKLVQRMKEAKRIERRPVS